MSHQITGSKLPSNGQVLRSLFYNTRQVKLSVKEAAKLTVQEVLLFWQKARIETRSFYHCITKLEKLHLQWQNLQKNANRKTKVQNTKIEKFKSCLDDLFDISHQDALETAAEEDKEFLLLQREKGRPGSMAGIDMNFVKAEQRKEKREREKENREVAEMTRLAKLNQELGKFLNLCLLLLLYLLTTFFIFVDIY